MVVASGRVVLGNGRVRQFGTTFCDLGREGGDPRKIRVIGDLRASGVNAVAAMHDTAAPDSLDCHLALAVYYRFRAPGCAIKAESEDSHQAYKTIGLPPGHEWFSALLLGRPCGPLLVSRL